MPRILFAAAASFAALAVAPALAAPSVPVNAPPPSLQDATVHQTVEAMKPGQYLWAPQVAPEGPVVIVVSIARQRAYAYRNGVPIGISTVSTGKKGHETPTGVFTVLQKKVDHKSNLYNDAPMPYMQRLTWDGIAMHAGNLPGYPASHGCVRLPLGFAQKLYEVTKLGLTVIVTADADVPRFAPTPSILSADPGRAEPDLFGGTLWQPERSTSGPVSIVISAADRRMLVLRNGVPIAGALNMIGADTLYGRYWGCTEEVPFLHFELCYYQAIDAALARGLSTVEAGAQGEHKLARGYEPVPTYSAHFIPHAGFRRAVADYLEREREAVAQDIEMLGSFAPFKKSDA